MSNFGDSSPRACDAETVDIGDWVSKELLNAANCRRNNCKEPVDHTQNGKSCLDNLISGEGSKLLRILLQLTIKGYSCSNQVLELCCILIPSLVSLPPSDFTKYRDSFSSSYIDDISACTNSNAESKGHDIVAFYNNIRRQSIKKNKEGKVVKASWNKRKRKLRHLTGRWYEALSTDQDSSDGGTTSVCVRKSSLISTLMSSESSSEQLFHPLHKSDSETSKSGNSARPGIHINPADMEQIETGSEKPFNGPFELATVLLDLLESSFCSMHQRSLHGKSPTSDGYSPMSVAMQLVSAITALQQSKGENCSYNAMENDKLMSQISYEDTRWTPESLSHLQRLVIRTVLVLCHVSLMEGQNLQEMVRSQAIESLMSVSQEILKDGGMVPHGTLPLRRKSLASVDDHLSDQDVKDTEKSTSKSPSVFVDKAHPFTKQFTTRRTSQPTCVINRPEDDCVIPISIVFVAEIIKGLFSLLTGCLKQAPGTVSPKQLTEVIMLLHEFDSSNGFFVFSNLLMQLNSLSDQLYPPTEHQKVQRTLKTCTLSPVHSPTKTNFKARLSPQLHAAVKQVLERDNPVRNLFNDLLGAFEKVIAAVQRSKVEYVHKVTCSRRSHRTCDLHKFVPTHHDILGEEAKLRMKKNSRNAQSKQKRIYPIPPITSNIKGNKLQSHSSREEESSCIVATCIQFLVNIVVNVCPKSPSVRPTLRSLDKVGVCQCQAVTSIVTPLLCHLECWNEKIQNAILAYVGKILLYHLRESSSTQSTETLSSFFINIPNSWLVKAPTSSLFTSNGPPKKGNNWRLSLPINMPSSEPSSSEVSAEESFFIYNLTHPWLCLVMYRKLLASPDPDLSLKVALHLQTISPHLSEESKMALSSLVLVPILCTSSGIKYSLMKRELSSGEIFREEIFSIVLGILLQYLESSDSCRAIFLRHGAIKAVNKILSQSKPSQADEGFSDHIKELVFQLGCTYLTSVTSLSPDVTVALFSYFKKPPLLKQQSTEPDISVSGPVKTFFRGFSWGSEKYRTESRERSTSFGSLRQKQEIKAQLDHDHQLSYTTTSIDELSLYYTELHKFVRIALALSGAITNDKAKERSRRSKNFSFGRALSGESTDSDPESRPRGRQRNLSETSGYRSTSPESLNRSISNGRSISSRSVNSSISYVADSVSLPTDDNMATWQQMVNYWHILGLSVPMDNQISTTFIELNGFDVALKLLTLVSSSLNEYYLSEMNFTCATQDITAAGSVLDKSNNSIIESPRSESNLETNHGISITVDEFSDEILPDKTIPLSSSPKDAQIQKESTRTLPHPVIDAASVDNLPDVPDFSDEVLDLKLIEMKLSLFTSCLRICLFCSRKTDQFEIDVDDIISSLRPTLTGKLLSTYFGLQLFSAIFNAAVSLVNKSEDMCPKISTVLQGLQRVVTSGGSATRSRTSTCHSRSNSASIAAKLMEDIDNIADEDDYDSDSDGSTTGGYDGDSEAGALATPLIDVSKYWNDCSQQERLQGYPNTSFLGNDLDFTPGPLLHPELLLLAIELLGNGLNSPNRMRADSEIELLKEKFAANAETLEATDSDVRECLIDAVGRALTRLSGYSKQNLDKMAKSDVAGYCFENFSDVLSSDKLHWKGHRDIIFSLCMILTKYHMTSKHLRLILSLFNSSNPPLEELLVCLHDLVEHQEFGPNFCLSFSWRSSSIKEPTSALPSDSESDLESMSFDEMYPTSPQRSLTVWRVAPLHMQLENHIAWPPMDAGVTISLWLRIGMLNNEDCGCYGNSWTEGHVIMVESVERNQASTQSSPYVHLLSIGSKQTMLQVWMENTTLIFRVCVDPNDGKPVGLLAQTECANFLQPNQWQHLAMTYTESRMPDKAILGKVHLILDCFIETDVILEFNLPQAAPKTGLSSWRQPTTTLNAQKVTFFLGHHDKLNGNFTDPEDNIMTASNLSIGNIMIFNLGNFSCQSAFAIEQLGADVCCFTECLSDSVKSDAGKESRVRFIKDDSNPKITPERGLSPSPRLFKLLPQTLNSDLIDDEIITGQIRPDFKSLQDALVLSYTPCEPTIFHLHSVAAPVTPTKKRKLFRRAATDTVSMGSESSPLIHCSRKVKVRKAHKEPIVPNVYSGLNRALSQVGGVQVFLLLYPKVIESSTMMHEMSSDDREQLQVLALKSLLHLRASDTKRRKEFLVGGIAAMLNKVMTKSECVVGYRTLQELMNTVCSEELVQCHTLANGQLEFRTNPESVGLIHDHEILTTFILDWKIWHKAKNLKGEQDFSVWTLLLQSLESLMRDDHIYQWFNIKALLQGRIVEKLLNGIQEMLNNETTPFPPPHVMISIVSVIRGVIGSPPDVNILSKISDFLIAVHSAAGTFVCHSTTSFYFSLTNRQFPITPRKLSDARFGKFGKSMENLRKVTTPQDENIDLSVPDPFLKKSPKISRTNSEPAAPRRFSLNLPSSSYDENDDSADPGTMISSNEENAAEVFEDKPDNLTVHSEATSENQATRHHLTPIPELDGKSPSRPRTLPITLPDPESDCLIITSDGDITMTAVDEENESGHPTVRMDSWENLPRPNETTTLHNSAIFETNEEEVGPEGLTVLVCELLNVLFISVMTMSDADVPLLFGEALTSEMLVVMLHHPDPEIRTAVLRMLAAFCSRCSSEEQNNFLRKKGFHLVANQLHQHPTTRSIAEACFYFLLGHPVVIDEQLPLPLDGATEHHGPLLPSPDPFSNHAVIVILAILEKSFWQGPDLCYHLVSRLNELFECMGPVADVMLDNGLTLALCNLLSAIGQEDQSHLPQADKQILYDVLEDLMGSVAVKSCVIFGSGHFQVFEDLMILLYTVEKKSLKLYGSTSDQVVSIKNLTYNLLLRVLDSMVHSSGGGKTHSLKNWSETSSSKDGTDSQDLSPMSPGFNTPPSSPTYSDPVMGKPPIPMSPNYKQHRRVVSLGNDVSSFVPSPSLSRARSHQFANRASYVPNDWKATSGFRPRSGGLRSRSFKGNQRRRINEAETAHRLQRVVVIAANRVVFTNKSTVKDTMADSSYRLKAYGPLHECGKHESQSINQPSSVDLSTQQRTFGQLLYDIIIEWLVVIIESLESHHKRHHVHSQFSLAWERILGIAQQTITHQASRLLTHFLSPKETNLRNRTYPLHIMNHPKIETLLTHLLPPTSKEGMKVTVYLQCLLSFHKLQLDAQNRLDVKKMSKCVYKIGHRISADVRRALHGSVSDVNSTDAIDDLQEKFLHDENRERVDWRTHNSTQYDLLVNRTLRLGEHVSRHAMDVTQFVVLQQNNQRKQLIVRMKDVIANDLTVRKKWTNLLEQLAHERAVWYNPKQYPKSWQLDPTEGPYRERRRLQRCHINIDKRFMLSRSKSPKATPKGKPIAMESVGGKRGKAMNVVHKRPLAFIFEDDSHSTDSVTIRTRLQTNERISTVQTCTNVTSACETTGELLIGENNVYFVGDAAITDPSHTQAIFGEREVLSLSWQQRDIVEYHKRWWQLRDTALEVFLMNGKTYLLAFNTTKERDFIEEELNKLNPPNLFPPDDLPTLTKSWCSGKITNFEYLTKLNKAAGRSFNDLMQYPVMPFVLSDYTSQILDLDNSSVYRKLEKPISVQDSSREQHFKERYKFLEDDYKNCSEDERELKTPPFHYGSHYSNSGTVLHFLVRLPPFTQMFLEYQDSSFDIPDRTFHSMATTYRLSSYASTTDVKELIPEFFFFPEFLCNLEGFDFGLRQCGIRVNHVTLPLWSKEDPRLFVLIHRQALESDSVTAYLHYWIDLVFGYKQLGQAALEAVNVFHPATYFGMDISSVEDPVKRTALETMVKTYGQTPKMLFPTPHPPRSVFGDVTIHPPSASTTNGTKTSSGGFNFSGEMLQASIFDTLRGTQDTRTFKRPKNSKVPRPIPSVKGLMWGDYVGSPSAPEPTVFLHKLVNGPIGMLVPLQTNDVCALAPKMGLLVVYTQDKGARTSGTSATAKQIDINWSALVTYNQPDNIIRLKLKHNTPGVNLTRFGPDDTVTCCATAPDSQAIIFGTKSGQIVAHRCNPMPEKSCDLEITPSVTLYCHSSKVTCLSVCGAYRIFVSGSQDGTAVIWDLDALLYVRSLTGHASDVTTLAISNTSGDICTVCDSGNDSGSHIRLWTINGSLVAAQDCKLQVRCVAFSSAPEGTSVNVVAGGLENGTVRLWSSWDLTHVRDVTTQSVHNPIVSVAFSHNSMVLYAATERGFLVGWCRKDKEREKQPLLITFLDSKAPPLT